VLELGLCVDLCFLYGFGIHAMLLFTFYLRPCILIAGCGVVSQRLWETMKCCSGVIRSQGFVG
jgi:hypothetical protein